MHDREQFIAINQIETGLDIGVQKEKVRDIPVCMIIPPSPFLADERVFPFLGPLKVAAELEKNGNPVDVLDLSGVKNYQEVAAQYTRQNPSVNIFGLTATTPQMPNAAAVRDAIKEVNPQAQILLGGPHVTLTYTASKMDQEQERNGRGSVAFAQLETLFDTLVIGDGEQSIFFAIDSDAKDKIINAGDRQSPLFLQKGTLDNYAFPARHLIQSESYKYYIDGQRAASVIAQLGCPFECGFCGGRHTDFLRMARTRSIAGSVVKEIEQVVKDSADWDEPIRAIMFYDDELNVTTSGLENLCMELITMQERLGVDMRFRGFIKAELFTEKQAKLMKQAGFSIVLSGVESGDNEILSTMHKHTSREINSRCVEMAHNNGLNFKALMSIGHPGESKKTIANSIEWALSNLRPGDDIDWTVITQYPGSPYFDHSIFVPEQNAWLFTEPTTGNRLWSSDVDFTQKAEYYKGVPGEYTAYVWTDNLSPDDLVAARDEAESITRTALGLPPISKIKPAASFEHSMGQGLPNNVLRQSR